jgi:alkanesulfonate monooxygenase SsuD/methylene tetrahydromethanopterin reductase-like flavin-dependent oxidoreductase (luciferase family)
VGDGWLVSSVTTQEVREGCEIIFSTAEEYNREIEEDHIGVLLGYYIAPNVEDTIPKAYNFVTRHRPDAYFTEYSALGPAEQIAEKIQSYVKAGASKFVVRPLCPAEETMEQLDLLGSEVLPHFHR